MERRVVITGLGAITPIGKTVEEFWQGIKDGKCGIDEITHFDTSEFKVKLAAEIKNYNKEEYFDKKQAKRLDEFSQYAIIATKEAIKASDITKENTDMEKVGVIVSSGIGGLGTIEQQCKNYFEKGADRVAPMYIPAVICNMAAGNVAIEIGAKGESFSIVTACASATHSIGESYRIIKHGYEEVMVEGAGILVLEELEHAKKRNATIYAEIVGYGATSDAYHITSPLPNGEGGTRAMKQAMEEAGITPQQLDYINAHGTSTHLNDSCETMAIKGVLGDYANHVMISSTKGHTGHLLGAAGAIEAIACVKALQEGFVPATIGYQVPDEECDLDIVPNKGRKKEIHYAMSNSLGFGGHNSSILLKKYDE